jgi:preprotein translocase subunit YajC
MIPEQAGSPFIPVILVFLVFYFLVIRPEKQKQKERKEKIANLKKNDQIVTTGGIHGTVVMVKESTVVLRVDDNTRIEFDKEAVSTVKSKE